MKHLSAFLLVVLSVVALSATAHARAQEALMHWNPTGNDLVTACGAVTSASSPDAGTAILRSGECLSFIQGTIDGFTVGEDVALTKPNGSVTMRDIPNIPNGVDTTEVVKVVMAYLDKHPEKLHLGASYLIYRAITSAWGTEKPYTLR